MDIVLSIQQKLEKISEIISRKSFQYVFTFFAAVLMFFGVMNTYAATALEVDWEGIQNFSNVTNGVPKGQDDMNSHGLTNITNGAYTGIQLLAPSMTEGGENLESDPDVPADMKQGLIGTTETYINYAMNGYPIISIDRHLAEEWIPGYEGSASSTYAADYESGYQELMNSGIVELWSKFRNLAYILFVVVMIVIGFMIMFRSKIGGQTMVTLGNTIPNIIVALILVTFSFAIAGLVIDLGGLLVGVLASVLGGDPFSIQSIGAILGGTFTGTVKGVTGVIGGAGGLLGGISVGLVSQFTTLISITSISSLGIGILAGGAITVLLIFVVLGVVLVGAVKLLFVLYKAYFGILINVILGPLQILMGAIPGRNQMFLTWIGNVARNVLVFPVVFFIVNIPQAITNYGDIQLSFPEKLTYAEVGQSGMDLNATGFVGMFILQIAVLFLAAQAPKYIESVIPSTTPKSMMEAMGGAKDSLSKLPLVGSLFK